MGSMSESFETRFSTDSSSHGEFVLKYMEKEKREHITISSSIIQNLIVKNYEETLGKKVDETEWIMDDDYGFAGFRLYFISPAWNEEGSKS